MVLELLYGIKCGHEAYRINLRQSIGFDGVMVGKKGRYKTVLTDSREEHDHKARKHRDRVTNPGTKTSFRSH